MNKSLRNIIIFTIVTVGAGFLGIGLDRLNPPEDPMQGLGALVWLVSPLLANILLRTFGGDGWKDFGLRLNLKSGWAWYLVAILITPLAVLPSLGLGWLSGVTDFSGFGERGLGAFFSLAGALFGAVMVKNIFEEFAWRGYLTPRLHALEMNPFANALLTGLIWAAWHIPYYLYFLEPEVLQAHTTLNTQQFILLAFLVLPFHAFAYGELRLVSKSTWTAWLLHNVANAISMTLLSEGFVSLPGGLWETVLTPGTQGILHALAMGIIGLGIYRYRRSTASE